MIKSLCLFAAASMLCLSLSADAAGPQVALVKSVSGSVGITRDGTAREATVGTRLHIADRVVTASNATVAIVFKDGSLVTLGADGDLLVRDYLFEPMANKHAFSLYLKKGSAVYESGKIAKLAPESVKVETPTATVGVRGTRFLIEAN